MDSIISLHRFRGETGDPGVGVIGKSGNRGIRESVNQGFKESGNRENWGIGELSESRKNGESRNRGSGL